MTCWKHLQAMKASVLQGQLPCLSYPCCTRKFVALCFSVEVSCNISLITSQAKLGTSSVSTLYVLCFRPAPCYHGIALLFLAFMMMCTSSK
uniref:Eukaryotic translation initiation factor 2c n=1 Tax=Rhizophora mucronata TaxID=61149 RepID=A0A2P2JPT8_RHIMU